MGRDATNRKTAEALLKTLQQLEADPALNPQDPAFVNLRRVLLQRLIDLDSAETQASIHLVQSPDPETEAADADEDTAVELRTRP